MGQHTPHKTKLCIKPLMHCNALGASTASATMGLLPTPSAATTSRGHVSCCRLKRQAPKPNRRAMIGRPVPARQPSPVRTAEPPWSSSTPWCARHVSAHRHSFNARHERKHRSKPTLTSALLRTEAKGDALLYRMKTPLLARIATQQYCDSASPFGTEPASPLRRSPRLPRMSRARTLKSP